MKILILTDVCELISRGISPKYAKTSGVRVLNQKCIRDNRLNYGYARIHDIELKPVNNSKFVQNGDVLINSTGQGTLGRTALVENVDQPTLVDSHITIVRPKLGVFEPKYFAYLISTCEDDFIDMATGTSGQTELPRASLQEYFIEYEEDILKQRRVVERLDAAFEKIDRAIELTEKNMSNCKTVFQSYLSDTFEHIAQESGYVRLGDVYDVRDGTHESPKYHKEGYPLVTSKNLRTGTLSMEKVQYISEADYIEINRRSKVDVGDVLMAMIGTIGNPIIINEKPNYAIKNVALFKPQNGQVGQFLKYYLKSQGVISKMELDSKGTTQKFVSLGYLREFPFIDAPQTIQVSTAHTLDVIEMQTGKITKLYHLKKDYLMALKQSLLAQSFSQSEVE